MSKPELPFADEQPQPVWKLCSCGQLATHWVKEDNRVPRAVCGGCLGRLERAVARGDADRIEEARRQERRKRGKSARAARKSQRGR